MRGAAGSCGGGGRRAARALLRLSDRSAAPESRAPGCGWEEAVSFTAERFFDVILEEFGAFYARFYTQSGEKEA